MIKRRLLTAAVLVLFAIGSSLFWHDGQVDWFSIAINLTAAAIGFVMLHFRWRALEKQRVSPKQAKETFS